MRRFTRPEWYRKNGAVIGYCVLSAVVAFCLAVVLIVALEGHKSHDAVCALREDLIRRVAFSEDFLHDHPHGTGGITRAELQRSIDGQRLTIKALAVADC